MEENYQQFKKQITMKAIHLTKSEFLEKVVDFENNPSEWKYLGDKPAIIDFYASWCGPCKMVGPIMEELARDYGDSIYVYKIDTEQEQDLATLFGIRSIPTVLFVPMNGLPQKSVGAMTKSGYEEAIHEVLLVEKK